MFAINPEITVVLLATAVLPMSHVIRQVGVSCMSVAGARSIFRGAPRGCREIRARQRDIVERRGHSTMAVLVSRRRFHVVFVCHDCLFRTTATTPICNVMQHYYDYRTPLYVTVTV